MSKNVLIKLNSQGVKEVLKSPGTLQVVLNEARKRAAMAGSGYVAEERRYPERVAAAVYPSDEEAWRDNLVNNTLEKVIRR